MRACPFCGFDDGWTQEFEDGFRIECGVCGSAGPKSKTHEGATKKWNGSLKDEDPQDKDSWNMTLEEGIDSVLVPKSEIDITSDLRDLYGEDAQRFGYKPGEIVNAEAEVAVSDNKFNPMNLDEWIEENVTPYNLEVIDTREGEDGTWLSLQGPIENMFAWGENEYHQNPKEFLYYIDEQRYLNKTSLDEEVGAPMATLGNTPGVGNVVPPGSNGEFGSGDAWGHNPKRKKKRKKHGKRKANEGASINPYDEIGKMMAKRLKVPMYFEKSKDKQYAKQKQNAEKEQGEGTYTYKISTLKDFSNQIKT